jgi:protein-disulfide isomerase
MNRKGRLAVMKEANSESLARRCGKPGAGSGRNVSRTIRRIGSAVCVLVVLGWATTEAATQAEVLLEALERGPGPSKGGAAAPVTLVEFSDFQCTYCRKFWRDTLPGIEEKYIRTGKVRFVYRHLAVLGPLSVEAAIAAECADEQGKFWPYHDRLFASGGVFALSEGSLKGYAAELGLDTTKFGQCMAAPQTKEKVERETLVARAIGMTGTPAFLINGRRMIGAQPPKVFEQILDALLKEKEERTPRP